MPPVTPYTPDLAGRDPVETIGTTVDDIVTLTRGWREPDYERTYAPEKWTARLILTHLAQTELALGTRARMALSTLNYTAQSFDQDAWMLREHALRGEDAVRAFAATAKMNAVLFAGLPAHDRATPLAHLEYGMITVDWIIYQMAGHQIHHLKQLQAIAKL